MSKVKTNYEIISNKSNNAVTNSEYIKHGSEWLDDVVDSAVSSISKLNTDVSEIQDEIVTDYRNLSGLPTINGVTLNGNVYLAEADENGKIKTSFLPSYVDDVLEYAEMDAFPATGESGKIYINIADNKTYRWSGTRYVEISESISIGEVSGTAYEGDKGKALATNLSSHTSNTTFHVTAAEKSTWNNKGTYSKPSGGIPESDLSSAVKNKLMSSSEKTIVSNMAAIFEFTE